MRFLLIPILLAMCLFPVKSQAESIEATCSWEAPLVGLIDGKIYTPAVLFDVQLSANDGEWVDVGQTDSLEIQITLESGYSYQARVRGVDAEGRESAWCLPSEPYVYGTPGEPTINGGSGCRLWVNN